ncbi:MAG: hypothetical protein DMG21_07700 [Acidobacteria bacterium]|nr:MAG: hypothetical protein DMG21_07700 [Acidobacteriota bacterium]
MQCIRPLGLFLRLLIAVMFWLIFAILVVWGMRPKASAAISHPTNTAQSKPLRPITGSPTEVSLKCYGE